MAEKNFMVMKYTWRLFFALLIFLGFAFSGPSACIVKPPPPGAVITPPPKPHPGARWVKGRWAWRGGKRVWLPGHYK